MDALVKIAAYMDENGIAYDRNTPGSELTTFRTGGPVSLVAKPLFMGEALELQNEAKKLGVPFFVIGNGSNLLIPDEGLDMLFIKLGGEFCEFFMHGSMLYCGAGASMAAAAKHSVAQGFMGLEWAAGIPGTVGGAVAMNAGAYGGEIKQVLKEVVAIKEGEIVHFDVDPDLLGYRHSAYSYPDMTVLEARFLLLPDDGGAASRMEDYSARRRDKQPLNYPSAGSTFKRPEGHFAGKLIEDAGLKGFSIGGACVSEKHAGFIINKGGAASADVLALIEHVRKTVFDRFGVMLEPEVRILQTDSFSGGQ